MLFYLCANEKNLNLKTKLHLYEKGYILLYFTNTCKNNATTAKLEMKKYFV